MSVSARAEYACLAMLELAGRHAESKPVRLTEITDKHAIPERFLVQILLQMKTAGLVNTTRGKAGGYQIAKSPEEITLADIVGALDGLGEQDERPASGRGLARTLREVWGGLAKTLVTARSSYLNRYRLSDLLPGVPQADYMI